MINIIFSILTREEGVLREVSAVFSRVSEKAAIHDILVPKTSGIFTDYAAEQVIQCMLGSYLRDTIKIIDPEARYNYPLEFPTVFSYNLDNMQDIITVSYREPDTYNKIIAADTIMRINGTAHTVDFLSGINSGESVSYTVSGGLSEPVQITDGVYINIRDFSGEQICKLECTLPYNRSITDIKKELPVSILHKYSFSENDVLPDYIATIAMDICVSQYRGE